MVLGLGANITSAKNESFLYVVRFVESLVDWYRRRRIRKWSITNATVSTPTCLSEADLEKLVALFQSRVP